MSLPNYESHVLKKEAAVRSPWHFWWYSEGI
jgi:hypothetical protein